MIEISQFSRIGEITAQLAEASQRFGPVAAAPADVARFEAAMAVQSETITAETSQVSAALTPATAPVPAEGGGIGDAILRGIERMRTSYADAMGGLQNTLAKDEIGAQELLSMQLQVSVLAIQQDLMGKIVSKATQDLDQLLKVQ